MIAAVMLAYLPMRDLPDRRPLPAAELPLFLRPVQIDPAGAPFRLAGAWELEVADRRFGGLSALAIDGDRFLAVSDLGAVVRFDRPGGQQPMASIHELVDGPGPFGKKWARDAESFTRDPGGRGWWIAFEQRHSLWLYDGDLQRSRGRVALNRLGWRDNRGAEGMLADGSGLLVLAENGREALRLSGGKLHRMALDAGAEVAEAATAPDGSAWMLLRSKGPGGIAQSVAPLVKTGKGYRAGTPLPLPSGPLDNLEGMAIEPRLGGGWRFWLVSDDGHRVMARTLLIALDFDPPPHDKSPATGAGLSKTAGNVP